MRGIFTSPMRRLVTQANPPLGTTVPMVGMRDSCQPIPELIIVAPAFSTSLARSITSSQVLPPFTKSIMDKR